MMEPEGKMLGLSLLSSILFRKSLCFLYAEISSSELIIVPQYTHYRNGLEWVYILQIGSIQAYFKLLRIGHSLLHYV